MQIPKPFVISLVLAFVSSPVSVTAAGSVSYLTFAIARAQCIKDTTTECEARVEAMREALYTVGGVRLPDDANVKRLEDQAALVSSGTYLDLDGRVRALNKSSEAVSSDTFDQPMNILRHPAPEKVEQTPIIIYLE